jgi:peptidyl-prolyl cis-trans isomerase A (cyclophilin A)
VKRHSFGVSGLMLSLVFLIACGEERLDENSNLRLQNPLLRVDKFNDESPENFSVSFQTTQGDFVIKVYKEWAPLGAARFYNLVKHGWYDGVRFHRVLENFMVGWGIHGDPYVNAVWKNELLIDDPVLKSNTKGAVSFAKGGANSRTVQVFINYKDNSSLDNRGFAPFGEVVDGMDVIGSLYSEYGDGPPRGEGVYQAMAMAKGAEYFEEEFPNLDRIVRVSLVHD